jgi:hypothetical protein
VVARAKAKLVMASGRPRRRLAGMPTTTAAAAPATVAMTNAGNRSAPCELVTHPPTAAPMAKKATWPSDTCPPHPDRTTSESPRMA